MVNQQAEKARQMKEKSAVSDKQKAAGRAASSRNQKPKSMKHVIAIGTVVGITVLCLILAFLESAKKMRDSQPRELFEINDATFISTVEGETAGNWTTKAHDFFGGWLNGDIKAWSGVRTSDMVGMPGAVQRCKFDDENIEQGVLPTAYDSRKEYPMCFDYEVYNTGNCSSSYATAAATSLGNRFCQADSDLHKNLRLSPQQILSCDKKSKGCRGGGIDYVWPYLENRGLYPESCLPFQGKGAKEVPCKTSCAESDKRKALSHCVASGTKVIKREIQRNGPIVAPMTLYDDFLVYQNGIYRNTESARPIYGWHGGKPVTHAVTVVGWGKHQGDNYWIVENSWGKAWGENGYARIAHNTVLQTHYALVGMPETPESLEQKKKEDEAEAIRMEQVKKERAERNERIAKKQAEAAASAAEEADDEPDDLDDLDLDLDQDPPEGDKADEVDLDDGDL